MCTTVEAFVCLLAISTTGMMDENDRPTDAPENIENSSPDDKQAYFESVCQNIVEKIWQQLDTDRLRENSGDDRPDLCCGEDLDEDVIGCECRSSCPRGEFFHYSCAGVVPDNIPVPWYCSPECQTRVIKPYNYCVCNQDLGTDEPMLGCSAESDCTRREWYHMRCVGIDPNKAPKGKWYCCDDCRPQAKRKGNRKGKGSSSPQQDLVQKYSTYLIWAGLNLLSRRDAVREADGEAIMSFWKFDLVHFFAQKHPKYLILAHRLIASINGWMPDRIRHDLIHNRTVNYSGGIGRNLPLDFMNEILNRLFKDLLDCSKGRYTDTTIQRCSQIVGPLGEALDVVFDTNVVENEIYRHRRRAQNRDGNVSCLINLLKDEQLFQQKDGRTHSAFQDFNYIITPRYAERFSGKIQQLSKRLDKRRRVVINN